MKKISNQYFSVLIALILIGQSACSTDQDSQEPIAISNKKEARSLYGMVASSHPLATEAGKSILENGGNAVDAAVATAFALAVVEPGMSGLGGRLQAIVRTSDGELHGIDATTQAPGTYDKETAPQAKYGYAVIGVPGMVAGAAKLNRLYGKLPLSELIAPAIKLAENGFYQLPDQANMQKLVRSQLLEFEGSKTYYIIKDDTLTYGPEDLLIQNDLANTLRLIADQGPDVFYTGEIAKKMVADVQAHGGALTLESLKEYEARDAEVLSGNYRGKDVHGLWIPSFGAITIEILHILENLPMNEYSTAEWASAVNQAINLGYADRYRQTSTEAGEELISKEYAKQLAEKITIDQTVTAVTGYHDEFLAWQANPGHTTHLSVTDKDGMIVSLTQSLGPIMGSRVVTPGLGFLYAATLGGYLGPMEPGQRAASHISPMILTENGTPYMAVGAAGGAKINSAIIQVICRIIDQKKTPIEALSAARVHPTAEGISLEMHDSIAWNEEDLVYLKENGFLIEEVKETFRFGRVHMVLKQGDLWIGAADPDGEGSAAGPIIETK